MKNTQSNNTVILFSPRVFSKTLLSRECVFNYFFPLSKKEKKKIILFQNKSKYLPYPSRVFLQCPLQQGVFNIVFNIVVLQLFVFDPPST